MFFLDVVADRVNGFGVAVVDVVPAVGVDNVVCVYADVDGVAGVVDIGAYEVDTDVADP